MSLPTFTYSNKTMQCSSFTELRKLSAKQNVPVDLETYIKKLANSRKRILLVNDILQNVQVCNNVYVGT